MRVRSSLRHGRQTTSARAEFPAKKKTARREKLARMGESVPCSRPLAEGVEKEGLKAVEKAAVRAFVEHPFHIVTHLFRQRKVRRRGLAWNGPQLCTLFALASMVIGARAQATA